MKKSILITGLLTVMWYIGYSQDDDFIEEGDKVNIEEVLNGYVSKVNPLLYLNLLFLHQTGIENKLIAIQEQEAVYQNKIFTIQNGTGNTAYSKQVGTNLNSKLEQYKSGNGASLWSIGENINVQVSQEGDLNIINSYIENYGEQIRSASLLQKGDKNKINLSLTGDGFIGSTDQWIKIHQYGNGHQAEAYLEPFSAPVEIIQTPGEGGAGMSISISNSYFSFPMK